MPYYVPTLLGTLLSSLYVLQIDWKSITSTPEFGVNALIACLAMFCLYGIAESILLLYFHMRRKNRLRRTTEEVFF